jgi:hypothetical protein
MVELFAEINGAHSIEINSPTIMLVEIACCRIVSPLMRLHIKPKASGLFPICVKYRTLLFD